MADAKVLNTNIKVSYDKGPEKFSIQATQVLFDGFLKLYMESSDNEEDNTEVAVLPEMNVGNIMNALEISASCKFTQAPQRYSEATLVKKLEELGIGRPCFGTQRDSRTRIPGRTRRRGVCSLAADTYVPG